MATLLPDAEAVRHCADPAFTLAFARIECHYFINRGFLKHEKQLFANLHLIQHIPTTIVHGRYDLICPVENASRLHKGLPKSELVVVPDAGHSAFEPGISHALCRATDRYAE